MMHFSHHKMALFAEKATSLGGAESPIKENAVGFVVPDEEEEGVVCIEFNGGESNSEAHLTPSASCGLRTLLIYFYKRLMENIGQKQVSLRRHSWEVGFALVKGIAHPHATQGWLEVVRLFQLELGKLQLHVVQLHHVRAGPLAQLLVSDGFFQLQVWNQGSESVIPKRSEKYGSHEATRYYVGDVWSLPSPRETKHAHLEILRVPRSFTQFVCRIFVLQINRCRDIG